jgi:hypothetical protein
LLVAGIALTVSIAWVIAAFTAGQRRCAAATWSEPMTTPPGRDEWYDAAQPGSSAPRRVRM